MSVKKVSKNLSNIFKKNVVKEGIILLLFLLYFRNTIVWIAEILTQKDSYEYGVLFLLVVIFIGIWLHKNRKLIKIKWEFTFYLPAFIGLISVLVLDQVNAIFYHFNIISAVSFFLGAYFLLGFYINKNLWKRFLFIIGVLCLTLPFIDHVQTFLGFPIRIITAKIVSSILGIMGITNLTETSVIITENNAISVDLPCSGIKSIYTGTLLLLVIYFLKNVRLSLKLLMITVAFYLSLLFFNLWRVFSLVYIYSILELKNIGDTIHIFLGIVGFILSAFILWYLVGRFGQPAKSSHTKEKADSIHKVKTPPKNSPQITKTHLFLIVTLTGFLLVDSVVMFTSIIHEKPGSPAQNYTFTIEEETLKEIPFTEKEEQFFVNRDVIFSKKYEGLSATGIEYSLLIVTSKSWRTHHNPEICLQGTGNTIENSEILQSADIKIKKLSINNNESTILYWFAGKDKTTSDYSERVWEGILDPDTPWTLVVLGFNKPIGRLDNGILETISHIKNAINN